jgi:hypothetical protein
MGRADRLGYEHRGHPMTSKATTSPELITLALDGTRYEGFYLVHAGFLTVQSRFGSAVSKLGPVSAKTMARLLLQELVENHLQAAVGASPTR